MPERPNAQADGAPLICRRDPFGAGGFEPSGPKDFPGGSGTFVHQELSTGPEDEKGMDGSNGLLTGAGADETAFDQSWPGVGELFSGVDWATANEDAAAANEAAATESAAAAVADEPCPEAAWPGAEELFSGALWDGANEAALAKAQEESSTAGEQPCLTGPDQQGSGLADSGLAAPELAGPDQPGSEFADSAVSQAFMPEPEPELFDGVPSPPEDEELQRLRSMLLGREAVLVEKLAALQGEKTHHTRLVSGVLAEAIVLRSKGDHRLHLALEPIVDDIVKSSFGKRQTEFAGVLGPLMGPSIRKSIAETFRGMLEAFSKSIEMAFSWKGLRWRFEAWRSGRPFSEIVLLHTLIYRVEQVFFIHGETGLVLAHAAAEDAGAQDADMVSAMLTAIQDFAKDCFNTGAGDELESLRMGDFTILLEKGQNAYLACVVRGSPPAALRVMLAETLDLMLVEFSQALRSFTGNLEPFVGAARYLESCLDAHYTGADERLPFWVKALPVLLLLCAGGALGYYIYERQELQKNIDAATEALHAEPGIVVVNVAPAGKLPCEIVLLKDNLAGDIASVVAGAGVDPSLFSFNISPFVSHDSDIIAKRAEEHISLPDSVRMVYNGDGTLAFAGTAPTSWILNVLEQARALPGVEHVDVTGLHDPLMERISAIVKEVESVTIVFPLNRDTPVPADAPKLDRAVDLLVELSDLARRTGLAVSLTVYGHADATGSAKQNYEISQARARTVAAALYAKGVSIPVTLFGMGSDHPKSGAEAGDAAAQSGESQSSRRIELAVHLTRLARTGADMIGK